MRIRAFLTLSVVTALGYGGYMFASPRLVAYEARAALRTACVAAMRDAIASGSAPAWEDVFLGRMRELDIELAPEQYLIELSDPCQKAGCTCEGQLAFERFTDWPLADLVGEARPPYRSVHRIQVDVEYR